MNFEKGFETEDGGRRTPSARGNSSVNDTPTANDRVSYDVAGNLMGDGDPSKAKTSKSTKHRLLTQIPKSRISLMTWNGKKCVEDCRGPKKKNVCPIRARRHTGNMTCVEVHELLRKMGIQDPEKTSACVRAGILRGHVKVTGSPSDLDMFMFRDYAPCGEGHFLDATLLDLLLQPDYPGQDLKKGMKRATIKCRICNPQSPDANGLVKNAGPLSKGYVSGICVGKPYFNRGDEDTHCKLCPGFGTCGYDFRERQCFNCGHHYLPDIFNGTNSGD